ncbi:MAG: alkaline phosphatase D family protein [Methylococcales bacterium]|nr:alkaline phosphatase D family protein [Methylococcales bacterium]
MLNEYQKSRRTFIKTAGFALSAGVVASRSGLSSLASLSLNTTEITDQPQLQYGIQFGDVLSDRAIIWSRADGPGKMIVEYSFNADFRDLKVVQGPLALEDTDYTARIDLTGLPAGHEVFIRVMFQYPNNHQALSEVNSGRFRTAPDHEAKNIRFLWSGDTCGQGWGINPDIGGMRIYETMRLTDPDFFIHCGDSIYADCPIQETLIVHETGEVWRNLVIPEVSKVAETLEEFRGRYKYNLLDHNLRRFNAEVPTIWLWDDHEVTNNWSPSKDLEDDDRYAEKNIADLVSMGTLAALEYAPIRYYQSNEGQRIYRKLPYGPLLEIFALDMRSFRGANNYNRQDQPGIDTAYLGLEQLDWLKDGLKNSTAVWKVIAADMPIGLQSRDGVDQLNRPQFESFANGNGPVSGREFEMAELLAFVKQEKIENMVWFTADVHYCAAHYYDPGKAEFKNFEPFWEFVSGPLNAGSFSPHQLDNTFGPQVIFQKASPSPNLSPLSGLQFFGQVDIDNESVMTVVLKDIEGNTLFTQTIYPSTI